MYCYCFSPDTAYLVHGERGDVRVSEDLAPAAPHLLGLEIPAGVEVVTIRRHRDLSPAALVHPHSGVQLVHLTSGYQLRLPFCNQQLFISRSSPKIK